MNEERDTGAVHFALMKGQMTHKMQFFLNLEKNLSVNADS